MTQNAKQAKKSRSFTVGVSFRFSSYYSLPMNQKFDVKKRNGMAIQNPKPLLKRSFGGGRKFCKKLAQNGIPITKS